ncbi:hypothetical protein L7F22_030690 [Adiantum nelumboides]|nr:hypothetical protein [Adiantum nelumboides]
MGSFEGDKEEAKRRIAGRNDGEKIGRIMLNMLGVESRNEGGDLMATWCGPCKMISPIFEKISEGEAGQKIDFYKVDVDEQEEISQEVGVKAMPTFAFFKNGEKIESTVGADPSKLNFLAQRWSLEAAESMVPDWELEWKCWKEWDLELQRLTLDDLEFQCYLLVSNSL